MNDNKIIELKTYNSDDNDKNYTLKDYGINMAEGYLSALKNIPVLKHLTNDSSPEVPNQTKPTAGTPMYFLQKWLEPIPILVAKNISDKIFGSISAGGWEIENVNLPIYEGSGVASGYKDSTVSNKVNINFNYIMRGIFRARLGFTCGELELAQFNKFISIRDIKLKKTIEGLNITIENINHFGLATNNNFPIYGLLNEPNLSPMIDALEVEVAGGGTDTKWEEKDGKQILDDIILMFREMYNNTNGLIDNKTKFKLIAPTTIPADLLKSLPVANTKSVAYYIGENMENLEIISNPRFNEVENGENVAYLVAENIGNEDVGKFVYTNKLVALRPYYNNLGEYEENYVSCSGGFLLKYPIGIVRMVGV